MKTDFNKELVEMDGKPMYHRDQYGRILVKEEKDENDQPIKIVKTLKKTCVDLLANANEEKEPGTKKLDKFMLAQRIQLSKGPIDLKADEILLIKDVVGKYEAPIVVGQVYKAIGELKK